MSIMTNLDLDIWKGDWGLASFDLECLRVLTYMKFIGVPVRVRESNNPFFTPNGTLPVLKSGKVSLTNFYDIVHHLKSLNFNTDVHLDTKQQAEVMAFTQYLKEKLYPAIMYTWWVDEKNYNEITRPTYAKAMRIPFNFYYPNKYHNQGKSTIDALYGEHTDLKEIENVIHREADICFKTLSDRLGESEYFFGSRPCSFDATVYAYIAPILKTPLPNNTLQTQVKAFDNLVKLVNRISIRFFKHITNEYSNETRKKTAATQADKDMTNFPNETRNKILGAIFAFVAMTGYAVASGLFEVNFRDEYTTSHEYNDMFDNDDDE